MATRTEHKLRIKHIKLGIIRQLMQQWKEIKEQYVQLRDEVTKSTKELAESETSVAILERTIGETADIAKIRTHVGAKKVALQQKVNELSALDQAITDIKENSYKSMKEHLDTYFDILRTTTMDPDQDANVIDDDTVVKVAKIMYPNVKDNHQLRGDPDIAGVTKFERNNIVDLATSKASASSNLNKFFEPICGYSEVKEWQNKVYGSTGLPEKRE